MNQAGQQATGIASGIATRPYQGYSGPLVADLSPNTQSGIQYAADSAGTGAGAIQNGLDTAGKATDLAKSQVGTGQGALSGGANSASQAGDVAQNTAGAGIGSVNAGVNTAGQASDLAKSSVGTGQGALSGANTFFGGAGTIANDNTNTGQADASRYSGLAGLAGGVAAGTTGAANPDINAARSYTGASAGPTTGSDISRYMNPYIDQALQPAANNINRQAGIDQVNTGNMAATRGAFGGDRQAILEGENQRNQYQALTDLYGTGYKNAFDNAQTQANAEKARYAGAAGLAQGTGALADNASNSAVSRLTQAGAASGAAGTTASDLATQSQGRDLAAGSALQGLGTAQSDLATQSQGRLTNAAASQLAGGAAQSGIATDTAGRLTNAAASQSAAGAAQGNAATADTERLLSTVSPQYAGAAAQIAQTQSTLNNLVQTGQIDQAQAQNTLDTQYQQFLNERDWATNQLNALIATLSGVPYSTNSSSVTHGQQVVSSPSALGQVAGGALTAASLFASDEAGKEDIRLIDDEAVLAKLAAIPVSTYRYKAIRGLAIGDSGEKRIGPMSQAWGREFSGNPDAKVIPMPQVVGALVSAVRALEKRTAPREALRNLKKAA